MAFSLRSALVASMALASAYAQVSTTCNPLNSTCPADIALGTFTEFDFGTAAGINPNVWNSTSTPIQFTSKGAEFTISQSGDSPTMNTAFNMFFGTVSVFMKAANGSGICSSITLLSDDLDEIDWEFLGSNTTMVESNFFGKGNTTTYDRAIYHTLPFVPQDGYHNYTVVMDPNWIAWIADDLVLRNLSRDDPLTIGGTNFPQTPMKLHIGAWAPGDPTHNQYTIEWAQGETDYTKGPYTMYVGNVYIQDGHTGASYTYGDFSGDWQSIKVEK
jgi:Glycosyl hydrolases family 16